MEDGVNQASTNAAVDNNLIPKYRLDEEIAKNRQLQAELQGTRQVVNTLATRTQPQAVEKDTPRMQKLKEEDPELYATIRKTQMDNRRLSAAQFAQNETIDKQALVQLVGLDKANSAFNDIEAMMDQARRQGNFTMTRAQAYVMLRGQEALSREKNPPKEKAATETRATSYDAPTSDPKAQGTTSSAARVVGSEPSLDELEKRLENEAI